MISTGTDVKPLECLLFMRMVNSQGYFEQMKGRGVRVIAPDDLSAVTPDVRAKTQFIIVDAVGVCEHDRGESKPLDRQPSATLKQLLDAAARGAASEDLASTLAARLFRLDRQLSPEQRTAIHAETGGRDLADLADDLLTTIDPDEQAPHLAAAQAAAGRPLTEQEADRVRVELVRTALQPFHNPDLRDTLLAIRAALDQIIDTTNVDELSAAGFSQTASDNARALIGGFAAFIEQHKDQIEALQVLYSRPYRAGLRYPQVRELRDLLVTHGAPPQAVWQAYRLVEGEARVRGDGAKLADLVALVRHVITPDEPLVPVAETVELRYQQWLAEQAAAGVRFSAEQQRWLDHIKDHIANSLAIDRDDFDSTPFSQLGGLGKVYQLFGAQLDPLLRELNERLAA